MHKCKIAFVSVISKVVIIRVFISIVVVSLVSLCWMSCGPTQPFVNIFSNKWVKCKRLQSFIICHLPKGVHFLLIQSNLDPLNFCSGESLLKGKDQYRWPPQTNKLRSAAFHAETVFFYKTTYLSEEVNCTELSPLVRLHGKKQANEARVTRCFCEKIAKRQWKIAQKVAQPCFC